MTENEPMAHTAAVRRAGGPVTLTRYRPSRSNVVGDILVHHTPDGDVPYRIAPAGFVRLTPQEWRARRASRRAHR
jgi:hypothetical protein